MTRRMVSGACTRRDRHTGTCPSSPQPPVPGNHTARETRGICELLGSAFNELIIICLVARFRTRAPFPANAKRGVVLQIELVCLAGNIHGIRHSIDKYGGLILPRSRNSSPTPFSTQARRNSKVWRTCPQMGSALFFKTQFEMDVAPATRLEALELLSTLIPRESSLVRACCRSSL